METPSSARRVTRSHTKAAASSDVSAVSNDSVLNPKKFGKKTETQQQDRCFLLDITNDSPIIGLAAGSLKTPSSDISRKRNVNRCWEIRTPGSGEALLRGQVKSLLQKVEEEAEITKISLNFHGLIENSSFPSGILAPANTPQIQCLLDQERFKDACFDSITVSPVQESFEISKLVTEIFDGGKKQDSSDIISRSLLSEFSDKAEGYGSSSEIKTPCSIEDDNSSVWSMQVNASIGDDEEDDYQEEKEEEMEILDELCKVMSKMQVGGKHIRFVYDSEDELVKEEEVVVAEGMLKLKGLPTPQGKHLRFPQEEEEEEEEPMKGN